MSHMTKWSALRYITIDGWPTPESTSFSVLGRRPVRWTVQTRTEDDTGEDCFTGIVSCCKITLTLCLPSVRLSCHILVFALGDRTSVRIWHWRTLNTFDDHVSMGSYVWRQTQREQNANHSQQTQHFLSISASFTFGGCVFRFNNSRNVRFKLFVFVNSGFLHMTLRLQRM